MACGASERKGFVFELEGEFLFSDPESHVALSCLKAAAGGVGS